MVSLKSAQRILSLAASGTMEAILVTAGAKGALFSLALALFDEGDEVLLPGPSTCSCRPARRRILSSSIPFPRATP